MKNNVLCLILALVMIFSNIGLVASASEYKPAIINQPEDDYKLLGEHASFTVEAVGDTLTYIWYYSKDGGNTFTRCWYEGYRTDTLHFDVLNYHYGILFYCIVKDRQGNTVQSDTVTLKTTPTAIITQPIDAQCNVGEIAAFTVDAIGNKLSYRWYYSKDGGTTWNKCWYDGYATNSLEFDTLNYQFGYNFKCVVSDKNDTSLTTDIVELKHNDLNIVTEPEDGSYQIGEMATFRTEAQGYKIKYRWYYSKDNGTTWSKCWYTGYATNLLSFETKAYQYSYLFRCEVTDAFGEVIMSEPATLLPEEITITLQPADYECNENDPVTFKVQNTGYRTSYQWYYSRDNGKTFIVCPFGGNKTSTINISKITSVQNGYIFYCVISDSYGRSIQSEKALLTVNKPKELTFDLFADESFQEVDCSEKTVIIDSSAFLNNSVLSEKTLSVSLNVNYETEADRIAMLRFTAYSEDENGQIRVKIPSANFTANYILSVDKTDYFIPVSNCELIDKIVFYFTSANQKISIGNFEFSDCGETDINVLKTGVFNMSESIDTKTFTTDMGFGTGATDLISDGEYLYGVYRGALSIYSLENPDEPELIATLDNLGNSRDIEFCSGKDALIISSRENGVFFVDITDKYNPKRITALDTLELATGVAVYGDFCFITSRNFGVEIYDISDIENPKYCSTVSASEEFYDCTVADGYLYVSVWAQRKVRIYDLSDVYAPVEVSNILLSGMGGGCDVDDGVLYVATGYHGRDNRSTITSPGYGMGNGLDIIDVSDPANPVMITSTRIDGRYYISGFDHWRVTVSDGFAYLTNIYNGGSVYDVRNPKAPKKVMGATVYIPKNSSYYKKMNVTAASVLPFDPTEHGMGIFTHAAVSNGYVYFATEASKLYAYAFNHAKTPVLNDRMLTGFEVAEPDIDISIDGFTVSSYELDGTTYAVVNNNRLYFCASGSAGVTILDSDMEIIDTVETAGIVKDVKVSGDYLYTAESEEGLGVYRIENSTLTEVARYNYNNYCTTFSYISVFPDGKHIAIQAGWTRFILLNIENPENPVLVEVKTTSTMYYRNFAQGLTKDGYFCRYDRGNIVWYGTDAVEGVYELSSFSNIFNKEENGTACVGEYALTVYNGGYVYYNPETASQDYLSSLEPVCIEGVTLRGKPSVCGNILVLSCSYGKQVTLVDISDLDNPLLIAQFETSDNPDVAYGSETEICIPMRHGGILKLTKI